MIKLANLTISRGGKVLLENVDLLIEDGQKAAIYGPSGCGKSSLLAALVGCFPADSGQIFINDIKLSSETFHQIRRMIAFIGQEPIMGAETVKEALLLPFSFHANAKDHPSEADISSALESLLLPEEIMAAACSNISGGERQRIAIARALLLRKNIFIADELTSALDKKSMEAVHLLLKNQETTLLSVSHDPAWLKHQDAIYEFSDKLLIAKDGTA